MCQTHCIKAYKTRKDMIVYKIGDLKRRYFYTSFQNFKIEKNILTVDPIKKDLKNLTKNFIGSPFNTLYEGGFHCFISINKANSHKLPGEDIVEITIPKNSIVCKGKFGKASSIVSNQIIINRKVFK